LDTHECRGTKVSMSIQNQKQDEHSSLDGDEERTFLDLIVTLVKRWRIVCGLPLFTGVVATVTLLLMPNVYTAVVRIMPPQADQSNMALSVLASGQIGSVLAPALGLKNPSDLYVGILKGNTIADRLTERFDLRTHFDTDTLVETRRELHDVTRIRSGRDGLIVIEVDDENPNFAAQVANAYVDELDKLTRSLAVTDAAQRRLFFE